MGFSSIHVGRTSLDKKIDGDSHSPIHTSSGDVDVFGHNNSDIYASSGDIRIYMDNNGDINNSSGDIQISRDNRGTLRSSSGDIEIGGNNVLGIISTSSGNISLANKNIGIIKTSSGKVKASTNSGEIRTVSGKVKVAENHGDICTVSGNIHIGNFPIKIKKSLTYASIDGIVSTTGNSIDNIVSCSNIGIIGGEVSVDGTEQTKQQSGDKGDEYLIEVDGVVINFNKKTYIDTYGYIYDISNNPQAPIRFQGESIIVTYSNQIIKIDNNQVFITGIV